MLAKLNHKSTFVSIIINAFFFLVKKAILRLNNQAPVGLKIFYKEIICYQVKTI